MADRINVFKSAVQMQFNNMQPVQTPLKLLLYPIHTAEGIAYVYRHFVKRPVPAITDTLLSVNFV